MAPYSLYILLLEDDCWYVGTTQRDVQTRFDEHDGNGYYPPAAFCQRHPPAIDCPLYSQDISEWIEGHPKPWLSERERAEDLERRITAQLILLCGVNLVRGGGLDDLVSSADYGEDDVDFITEKVAGPLGLSYMAVAYRIMEMLADEENGDFPPCEPETIFIDENWNVVLDGQRAATGFLTYGGHEEVDERDEEETEDEYGEESTSEEDDYSSEDGYESEDGYASEDGYSSDEEYHYLR